MSGAAIDTRRQTVILRSQNHSRCSYWQKLFYKNGDAFVINEWDDSPPYDPSGDICPDNAFSSGILSGSTTIFFTHPRGTHLQGKALEDFVIDKIDDLKGQDIVAIDVHGKSSITDCMVICTGTSSRHVMSIADHVVQESRAAGLMPLGVEGENVADWVVVDLGDVIVHVMQEESRRLYELEKLWS